MKHIGIIFAIWLVTGYLGVGHASAQEIIQDPNRPAGLIIDTDQEASGYILASMLQTHYTLLISNDGRVVKYWESSYNPGLSNYLMEDGSLIHTARLSEVPFGPTGIAGFVNGLIESFTWDNDLLWSFDYVSEQYIGHHDIEPMPNGNILVLAYDRYFTEDVLAAGRNPDLIPEDGDIWSEKVVEINPETGEIVWEWRVWDHLIQDYDPTLENYGVVSEHPERVNINYMDQDLTSDWLHMNAVAYNAELDQIILSSKSFSELWIVDHSISTEEARGTAGDLLFRWGNPEAYSAGTDADQLLYGQHDTQWITTGYPGEGNILLFDNGDPERPYSRVIELAPVTDENGSYVMPPGEATATELVWEYVSDPVDDFYSIIISGAQRQPNGNTLITEGTDGRIFEVTPEGQIVWEYYLPPGTMAFRAERYDLSLFAGFDEGQDFSDELGFYSIWGKGCVDGTQPRLHAYISHEMPDIQTFIATYGEAAQATWETEACSEHGGLLEINE